MWGCPKCGKNINDNRYKCHGKRKKSKRKTVK